MNSHDGPNERTRDMSAVCSQVALTLPYRSGAFATADSAAPALTSTVGGFGRSIGSVSLLECLGLKIYFGDQLLEHLDRLLFITTAQFDGNLHSVSFASDYLGGH